MDTTPKVDATPAVVESAENVTASVADARKSAPGARASTAAFYRDTGLVLDPSGAVHDAPAGAAFEFEHWGAGGNTGVSGQVTRESA